VATVTASASLAAVAQTVAHAGEQFRKQHSNQAGIYDDEHAERAFRYAPLRLERKRRRARRPGDLDLHPRWERTIRSTTSDTNNYEY
jgi:hypothetical protein